MPPLVGSGSGLAGPYRVLSRLYYIVKKEVCVEFEFQERNTQLYTRGSIMKFSNNHFAGSTNLSYYLSLTYTPHFNASYQITAAYVTTV